MDDKELKELIDNHFADVLATYMSSKNVICGDIMPTDSGELYEIRNKLANLIKHVTEYNRIGA